MRNPPGELPETPFKKHRGWGGQRREIELFIAVLDWRERNQIITSRLLQPALFFPPPSAAALTMQQQPPAPSMQGEERRERQTERSRRKTGERFFNDLSPINLIDR